MKKLFGLAVGICFLPVTALAGVTCAPSDHPVYDSGNSTVVSCITDSAWQASVDAAASRNAQKLPVVASGTVLTDASGRAWQVPNIIYLPGWLDLTHSQSFIANQRLIAEELQGNFGWGYWLSN